MTKAKITIDIDSLTVKRVKWEWHVIYNKLHGLIFSLPLEFVVWASLVEAAHWARLFRAETREREALALKESLSFSSMRSVMEFLTMNFIVDPASTLYDTKRSPFVLREEP